MRTKLTCLCAVLLLTSLSACGSPSQNQAAGSSASASASASSATSQPPASNAPVAATPEILAAQLFDGVVQINNTVLQLPLTHEKLVSAGAQLNISLSPDFLMEPKGFQTPRYVVGTGELLLSSINKTNARIAYQDSTLTGIFSTKSQQVFFPKGIHIGSTLSELTAAWGEPTHDSTKTYDELISYQYISNPLPAKSMHLSGIVSSDAAPHSMDGYYYRVSIDRNTSKIVNIYGNWNTGVAGELVERSEILYSGQGEQVVRYSVPSILAGANSAFHNLNTGVLEVGDSKYAIILDGALSGLGMQTITTQETLSADINNSYIAQPYEIEFLELVEGETARILASKMVDGSYLCEIIYMQGTFSYRSYNNALIPMEGSVVDDAAIAVFHEYVVALANSITVVPAG